MATKLELEKQIKTLKNEIRNMRNEAKVLDSDIVELKHSAHGVILEDGVFKLVSLKFDGDKAVVADSKDLGKSLVAASSYVKKAVIDNLVEVNKRRG